MNVIERNNKRPLMVVRENESGDIKKSGEITCESDSSTEVRSCKTVYRNRCKKLVVVSDTSLNIISFTDSNKNDRKPIIPKCLTDKKDEKGI